MQKQSHISIYITTAILLGLTACGSVWDLEIAKAVYIGERPSENMFGIIFSFIGIIPTFVGWSFLGASILCLSKKQIADIGKRRRHIAFAIFLFPALADYAQGLKKFKAHLFILGFAWWAVTAVSRLTTGAHYLTDVTIAGLVTIFAYTIVSAAMRFYSKGNKKREVV